MKQTESQRIKILRTALGLTQKEFSDSLSITSTTLWRMEMSEHPVSTKTQRKICETFNVSGEWLSSGKGDMFTTGTAEENRKLAMSKGSSQPSDVNPWRDALVDDLKSQVVYLQDMLKLALGNKNFLKAFNAAARQPINEFLKVA